MIRIKDEEITTVLSGMQWSGAKDKCCRTLTFQYLYNPGKSNDIPFYSANIGDKVLWTENNKILFRGYIEKIEYTTREDVITITCQDLAARLMHSKCNGRFRGTLKNIANNICNLFGIKNGIDINSTHNHNIVTTGKKTYFDVLKIAGETVFGKNKFNYYMDGDTLKLAEKEVQKTFKTGENIRESKFEHSLENLVTKVLVFEETGTNPKIKINQETFNKYGLFQASYNWDKDCKDNYAQVQSLLEEPQKKATIVCDNDNNCLSGRYIKIDEPVNGFNGTFEILTDTHTINADSEMTLEVREVQNV